VRCGGWSCSDGAAGRLTCDEHHARTHKHTQAHARTHTRARARTHARARARKHARTHARARTQECSGGTTSRPCAHCSRRCRRSCRRVPDERPRCVCARAHLCARAIVGLLTCCVLARYAALRMSARARPEESPDGPSGSVATCRGSVATCRGSVATREPRGQPQPPRPVCEEGLRRTQCLLCRRRSVARNESFGHCWFCEYSIYPSSGHSCCEYSSYPSGGVASGCSR
jgi:hypothetical protein